MRLLVLLAVLGGWAVPGCAQEDPLAPGEHRARLGELTFWYHVRGQGPVIIVPTPGWGPSGHVYVRTLQPLERWFTVVCFETRGSGRSERPANHRDYRWRQLTADIDGLRRHLGLELLWFFGHAGGGMQALHYAVKHPSYVRGVVLCGTRAETTAESREHLAADLRKLQDRPWFAEARRALAGRRARTDEEFAERMLTAAPLFVHDEQHVDALRDELRKMTFSVAAQQGHVKCQLPVDLRPRLGEVAVPTLILTGRYDLLGTPRQAEALHLGIKGSKLLVIDDAGHFPWIEQPSRFWTAVESGLRAFDPSLVKKRTRSRRVEIDVCQQRLAELYKTLVLYQHNHRRLPKESGPAFVLAPWVDGIVDRTVPDASLFFCPSTGRRPLPDLSNLTAAGVDYTGPDQSRLKGALRIGKWGTPDVVIACDRVPAPGEPGPLPHGGQGVCVLKLTGEVEFIPASRFDGGRPVLGPKSSVESLRAMVPGLGR